MKLEFSIQVPPTLQKLCQVSGADLRQEFSLQISPQDLPVVTQPTEVHPSFQSPPASETRYRVLRFRVSPNQMTVLDQTKEVPVMLYDNLPKDEPEARIRISLPGNEHQAGDQFDLRYSLSEENHCPRIPGPDPWSSQSQQLLQQSPQQILEEPWDYLAQPQILAMMGDSHLCQGVMYVRIAGNPESLSPLTVFGNRVYALFALDLLLEESLLGLDAESPGTEDRPKMVLGRDMPGFCEKFNWPLPRGGQIHQDLLYLPVDPNLKPGSPVMQKEGEQDQIVGMVMVPGFARLFTEQDLEVINHAGTRMEPLIEQLEEEMPMPEVEEIEEVAEVAEVDD